MFVQHMKTTRNRQSDSNRDYTRGNSGNYSNYSTHNNSKKTGQFRQSWYNSPAGKSQDSRTDEPTCYLCGQLGHKSYQCERNKPKDDKPKSGAHFNYKFAAIHPLPDNEPREEKPSAAGAYISMKLQNKVCWAYADSGSCVSIISPSLAREMDVQITPSDTKLITVDGSPLKSFGTVRMDTCFRH